MQENSVLDCMFPWLHSLNQSSFEQTNENIFINRVNNPNLFFTETELGYTELGLLIKDGYYDIVINKAE